MPNTPLLIFPPTPFRQVDAVRIGGSSFAAYAPPTIRYVRKSGSNSNGGTSPSDAWQTLAKASATATPGTIVYVGAGTYREAFGTPAAIPTNFPGVSFIGDIFGLVTGDAGPVIQTMYTTNDRTAPPASISINMGARSFISYQNFIVIGGSSTPHCLNIQNATNYLFKNCAFIGYWNTNTGFISIGPATGAGSLTHGLFDGCFFIGRTSIAITLPTQQNNDYDTDVEFRNCIAISTGTVFAITPSGSLVGKGGGVRIRNCTVIGGNPTINTSGANLSTAIPCEVRNSIILSSSAGLSATTLGQIAEDYNYIGAVTPRTNVGVGPHSIADGSMPPIFMMGFEKVYGGMMRQFGEPLAGTPFNDFGAFDTLSGLDYRGLPRPSSPTKWAIGAVQRNNSFSQEVSTVNTGLNAISCIGFGAQDFDIPVDAGTNTISIYCQYDSNYDGPKPSLAVVKGQGVGVGDTEVQASRNALNNWEQLSLTINPTAAGIVTVRFISRDTSDVGKCIFDTFAIA